MIIQTERAICERLRQGLGRMSSAVRSYGGELDGDLAEIARQLPAVWVTFGGIQKTENVNVGKRKYKSHGRFVVIVGERNVRSEEASRQGGPNLNEVGTYKLIAAVRRLLSGQDMSLPIEHLIPGRVRTLFNTPLEHQALSVYACEFDTAWIEEALENGAFPLVNAPADSVDSIFTGYQGKVSQPDPDWLTTRLDYHIPGSHALTDGEDIISHE